MAFYRERGFRELTTDVTHEGVGIGGGFIVGGVVGRQVENMLFKSPVTDASPISSKLLAWLANNGAKGVVYLLAKHYEPGSEFARNATKALAGSIVYDTVLRVANHGWNPADVTLAGYRILGTDTGMEPEKIQKLIQENSLLRTELNKALQRLAGIPEGYRSPVYPPARETMATPYRPAERYAGNIPGSEPWGGNPDMPNQIRYGGPPSPAVADRQRTDGAMPFDQHPVKTERQRRFGAMEDMGFKPDAKDTAIAKMFNMQ